MAIAAQDYEYICNLLKQEAAITLDGNKRYLVESRLGPLAQEQGYNDLAQLAEALRRASARDLRMRVVDALTTNETYFFRDAHPFEVIRTELLPPVMEANRPSRRLRIWSAASSTGQEAYSLAMLLAEHFPELATWNVEIVGTDISPTALAQAESGVYSQLEVNRGLPARLLVKYFEQRGSSWHMRPQLKAWTKFKPLNLAGPWPYLGQFDLVLLRNVLIYFAIDDRKKILERIAKQMVPQAALLLGAAETTSGVTQAFTATTVGRTTVHRLAK